MEKSVIGLLIAMVALQALVAGSLMRGSPPINVAVDVPQSEISSLGSVSRSSEYHSTTTNWTTPSEITVSAVPGALGSIILTGPRGNGFDLFDATTTAITSRASTMTTNTILIGSFPGFATSGVYTFDTVLLNGLTVVFKGTVPSSTITYRP